MIKEAIDKIVCKEDLSYDEAYAVMTEIMSGETSPTQNAAFLAALSTKSTRAETIDEISGCAAAMREKATPVDAGALELLEIVGTGGDRANTFNISTTAALLCASAGARVAKHGNRAASSLCGTADCLEALGVNLDQDPARARRLLDEVGMCFLFAQKYHPAMKYVGAIRRELGIPVWYIGVGGVVTFKNASLAEVVKKVPLERIVLETDAPYLTPVPYRGKRNESSYIPIIAAKVAELKSISVEEVAETTTNNAKNLFGI